MIDFIQSARGSRRALRLGGPRIAAEAKCLFAAVPELEDQMCAFVADIDRAAASPDRVDALVWCMSDLMLAPMASYGIYELYRQMAEEQTTREAARIAAPDPRLRRQDAILAERSRYAALMADRPPTPARWCSAACRSSGCGDSAAAE